MKHLLGVLRHGRELRHLGVALDTNELSATTRAFALRRDGSHVPVLHVPTALHPLTFALWADAHAVDDAVALRMTAGTDASSRNQTPDATISLRVASTIDVAGLRITLYQPRRASNRFAPMPQRWWAYALAWRSARRTVRKPGGLGMTALELRALDCYYTWPRPVYLVSVRHAKNSNIFPMDLVGPFGMDRFTLALRNTSPSVQTMRESRRVVLSVARAEWKQRAYALGAHHRRASIDPATLAFPLAPSPTFGFLSPADAPGIREVEIEDCATLGSHTFFVARTVHLDPPPDDVRRFAHVSGIFAAWRARTGTPFVEA